MSRVTPELREAAISAIGGRAILSDLPQEMQVAIGNLVHAAMTVEREACARVAEATTRVLVDYPVTGITNAHAPTAAAIAAAIRKRKE